MTSGTISRRFAPRRTRSGGRVRYTPRQVRLRAGLSASTLAVAAGHEVSEPLSSVTSLADLLAQDWTALPEDVRRDLARRIDSDARGLSANFGHILALMDLFGGKVVPGDAVPLRASVDSVVAALPPSNDVGVAGPDTPALVNRVRLEHVLTALIGDAMTYGARPVRIRIVPEPESVRIVIADHGHASPRQVRAHALSPATGNWTLVSREATDSRALGLAVAARLVATDGGTIWLRPMRRSHGSRVLIRLSAPTTEPA
jgi:signal transduction histidine kinase